MITKCRDLFKTLALQIKGPGLYTVGKVLTSFLCVREVKNRLVGGYRAGQV